jgi:hypothetical protein
MRPSREGGQRAHVPTSQPVTTAASTNNFQSWTSGAYRPSDNPATSLTPVPPRLPAKPADP